MSKSSINIALLIIFALVFFRVLLGPWGWIGAGDATLYQQVSACVEAPEQSVARTCFSPDDTSSMLPVAVVGFSAKLFGADSVRVMLRSPGALTPYCWLELATIDPLAAGGLDDRLPRGSLSQRLRGDAQL